MDKLTADGLARLFHAAYERLAPEFGYETRGDTREFDPEKSNGRLMLAVSAEILSVLAQPDAQAQQPVAHMVRYTDSYGEPVRSVFLHDPRESFKRYGDLTVTPLFLAPQAQTRREVVEECEAVCRKLSVDLAGHANKGTASWAAERCAELVRALAPAIQPLDPHRYCPDENERCAYGNDEHCPKLHALHEANAAAHPAAHQESATRQGNKASASPSDGGHGAPSGGSYAEYPGPVDVADPEQPSAALADELEAYFRSGYGIAVDRAIIKADFAQHIIAALRHPEPAPRGEQIVDYCASRLHVLALHYPGDSEARKALMNAKYHLREMALPDELRIAREGKV